MGEGEDLFGSIEPDEFSLNDFNSPILVSDGASSTVSQCVGDSMEPFNFVRSLDSRQTFDIADQPQEFCLKDGQEKPPTKLKLPNLKDLSNLVEPQPESIKAPPSGWPGIWYCIAGDKLQLVCCKGTMNWDSSRDDCKPCKSDKQFLVYYQEKLVSSKTDPFFFDHQ